MDNRIDVVLPPENRESVFQAVRNVKLGIPGSQSTVDELGKLFKQKTPQMKVSEVK